MKGGGRVKTADRRASRGRRGVPPQRLFPDDGTREVKVYGVHACASLAKHRREEIIRVFLSVDLKDHFSELLKFCVATKRAYRFLKPEELVKVSGSLHHEGVCVLARDRRQPSFDEFNMLLSQRQGACGVVFLDGVGNPHNFGAILRVCAHFGVFGVLVPGASTLTLSGAACRTAQGGAEVVSVVQVEDVRTLPAKLRSLGFSLVAATVREARDIRTVALPARSLFLFGAEEHGLSPELEEVADFRVTIPGTGLVESLNVACASAALLSEFTRQHRGILPRDAGRERGNTRGTGEKR